MPIVVVGMLDEREEALAFLKGDIEERGHRAILIDISMGVGEIESSLQAEVSNEELAGAAGMRMEQITAMLAAEREKATAAMAEGLTRKVLDLYSAGQLEGVVAVGGMTSTLLCVNAMKALPFGVPKLLISSAAAMPAYAPRFSDYFGVRDITVMHSVVDTVGSNPLVRGLMRNGAGAICGMAQGFVPIGKAAGLSIALTEFGFCDSGAHAVRESLRKKGYNIVSFHATGLGDRAAEDLVRQGLFEAFIDMVPASLSEHLLGGNRDAGPDRLEAAVDVGIPYIVTPCGFDMLSCGPLERRDRGDDLWVSRRLAERKLFVQDAMRVQARTSIEEMKIIAAAVAEKLNRHRQKARVKFLVPTRGFSSLSGEGRVLHDPAADRSFVEALRGALDPDIELIEVDAHINTHEFAEAVVEALGRALEDRGRAAG